MTDNETSIIDKYVKLTALECASVKEEDCKGITDALLHAKIVRMRTQWRTVCPRMYDTTDESRFDQDRLNVVMSHDMSKGKGLFLHGEAGKMKTRAAWLKTGYEFARLNGAVSICYLPADEFGIKASSYFKYDIAMQMIDKAKACDILIFDDIFKAKLNENQELVLFGIINHRMECIKPTIYTTNANIDTLWELFTDNGKANRAEPIMRRLGETCTFIKF